MTKRSKRRKTPGQVQPVRGARRRTDARPTSRTDPHVQALSVASGTGAKRGVDTEIVRLRAAWYMGDWETLANVDVQCFTGHPECHVVVLLTASAQQQLGRHEEAREHVRLALSWDCPPRLVAQILVAGVHNTLGRAAALARDTERAKAHFDSAVLPGTKESERPLISQVRSIREMGRLNLFPEALQVLGAVVATTRDAVDRPEHTNARIKVLESELDLLSHELSLAQQRRMVLGPQPERESRSLEAGDVEGMQVLSRRSVSQLGQDLWVLQKSRFKRGGFFVEFGAADGVLLSNSYLLEAEFGWSGICSEPNPKMFEQLRRNRRCIVSNACIGGFSGRDVEFIFAGAFGGIAEHCAADLHRDRRAAYAAAGHVGRVTTISLDEFLKSHGAPHDIDYLSIDTEGSELEILSSFPFGMWNVRLITVEHNNTPQKQLIFELLQRYGYQRLEREWEDWYCRADD